MDRNLKGQLDVILPRLKAFGATTEIAQGSRHLSIHAERGAWRHKFQISRRPSNLDAACARLRQQVERELRKAGG